MDLGEALEVLRLLADGVIPHTGECFPVDSPYQHPDVVRALYETVKVLEPIHARRLRRGRLPQNSGAPWTDEEDAKLAAAFETGQSIDAMVESHRRTRSAIIARLLKLGRLSLATDRKPASVP